MVYLPRCKLIGCFHVIHNFLQRLFIFDIHLIADFPLSIPIVDHDGQIELTEALRASRLEGAFSKGRTQQPPETVEICGAAGDTLGVYCRSCTP